jgi:hypothetical protein
MIGKHRVNVGVCPRGVGHEEGSVMERGSVEHHKAAVVPVHSSQLVRGTRGSRTHQSLPVERTDDEATVDELVTPALRVCTRSSMTVEMVG